MSRLFSGFHDVATCAFLFMVSLAAGMPSWAQDADDAPPLAAPARLSVVEGTVSFWRPGDTDWSPAQLNTALAAGDAIYTGDDATVEIQIGPRAYVRLMAATQIEIQRQEVNRIEIRLTAGTASFDLRALPAGQAVQVDTPNAALALAAGGYYRAAFEQDVSRFVVRRGGKATLGLRDGYQRTVVDGEQMIVRGQGELIAEVAPPPMPDSWDRWNEARSDYYDRAAANRYLSPDMYGAADLDQYGTWQELPEYGAVWMPDVPAGWAPFSVGAWRWDPVYQWTWIDQAPWGWAPSHYGRWVYWQNRWAWAPGPRVLRPAYLPAVVAFVGLGGDPGYGWVALSWGEPVVPWWGPSRFRGHVWWGGWGGPRVINNVVVRQGANVNVGTIIFRNSHLPFALRTARAEAFQQRRETRSRERDFRTVTPETAVPYRSGPPDRNPPARVTVPPRHEQDMRPAVRPRLEPAETTSRQPGSLHSTPSGQTPVVREQRIELRQPVPAPRAGEASEIRQWQVAPKVTPQEAPSSGSSRNRLSPETPAAGMHGGERHSRPSPEKPGEDAYRRDKGDPHRRSRGDDEPR